MIWETYKLKQWFSAIVAPLTMNVPAYQKICIIPMSPSRALQAFKEFMMMDLGEKPGW
jgi:hypothetical protein